MNQDDLIYDWNVQGIDSPDLSAVELHDETIRDGIQSPSVTDPTIEQKLQIVRLLDKLGVASCDLALPGAGPRAVQDCERMVELIRDEGLAIRPSAAARTLAQDIQPIIEITQRTGVPVEAMMFLGTSPIRLYTEGWDEARLEKLARAAIKMAVKGGIPATFVTEDTVRSQPKTLRRLFEAVIEEGADRIVLCDTVGHATADGVTSLVRWTHDLLVEHGVRDTVRIDWHQHEDRGLSLTNTLAAMRAGVDRVHGTVLGVGERIGNTALDVLLVNLKLMGHWTGDLQGLGDLCDLVSQATQVPIPMGYPIFGRDAFRTGTGVHAAAVIKAHRKGDDWLADRIYSGVPAEWFGRRQIIEIGHQSGMSNVRFWLERRGMDCDESVVRAIFDLAKQGSGLLTEEQILAVVRGEAQTAQTLRPNTHHGIDPALCGRPTELRDDGATVALDTLPAMAADHMGLVHGGFIFGLADYAAMLAVNDPNVVLGAAETRLLAPVRVGQTVVATATVQGHKGRKRTVQVACAVDEKQVMTGIFTCFVLDEHVLNGREA